MAGGIKLNFHRVLSYKGLGMPVRRMAWDENSVFSTGSREVHRKDLESRGARNSSSSLFHTWNNAIKSHKSRLGANAYILKDIMNYWVQNKPIDATWIQRNGNAAARTKLLDSVWVALVYMFGRASLLYGWMLVFYMIVWTDCWLIYMVVLISKKKRKEFNIGLQRE